MTLEPKVRSPFASIRVLPGRLFRFLASKRLSITLAALFAAAFGCALVLESTKGREYADWHVYHTSWFIALLGLLAANLAAAVGSLCPWPLRRLGQAVALVGLLLALAGFVQTLVGGIDGLLILGPGQTTDTAYVTARSQLVLLSRRGQDTDAVEIGFSPGPADWRDGETLDFGDVGEMVVKVLKFYRHARYEAGWVPDNAGQGKPAIQVSMSDSQPTEGQSRWLVPVLFGNRPAAGEPNVSIEQASVPSLRDDFLQPPPLKPGSLGVLSVHANGRAYPIPVDGNLGKKLSVGDTGFNVEIVEYLADAKSAKGKFSSDGVEPKNPMLRLRVYSPNQKEPVSEIAYSSQPFVNFETIKKQQCPVKFWYHHPSVTAAPGVEFLQTPDEKLFCRVVSEGAYHAKGEVKPGDRIALSGNHELTLLRHIPHARPEGAFTPVEVAPGESTQAEAAALVELTTADKTEQFWLGRNDAQLGVRKLQTPAGPLLVLFGYDRRPLGFAVKLVDIRANADTGATGDGSWVSRVQFSAGVEDSRVTVSDDTAEEVATGSPLEYGVFRLNQYGVRRLPDKSMLSVLRVTSDPGRLLKYWGGALVCGGILFMLIVRILVQVKQNGPSAAIDLDSGSRTGSTPPGSV